MGSCHVSGYPETVGPSLHCLTVSGHQSGSLKGGAVSANRPHTLFSTEEEEGKEGEKRKGEAVAQSYFNYTTYFEGLESEPWADKKHRLMKRKAFLSEALCSPDQQALKSFLKPLGSLQGPD